MLRYFKKIYRLKENLNVTEMKEIIDNNNNVIIVDVRSPQEFSEHHIKNAINIPTYEIYEKAKKIIPDKETIIICYCSVGIRSKKAIKMLRKLGYINLYHLEEGI